MKTLKVVLIVLGAIIVLIAGVAAYFGAFKKVNISEQLQGGEIMIYERMIGDYSQTPKITDKIYYALLNEDKIETTKGVGVFYDNPQAVAKENLRSDVGCIVENIDSITLNKLSKKFLVQELKTSNYLVAEFPIKGGLSFLFGIMKVYPALNKYCQDKGYAEGAITEIYDMQNKKIVYRKEIAK